MAEITAEEIRLRESPDHTAPWRSWGPYVSERAWGTVREDYSANGERGNIFRMITLVLEPTAGAKMGWLEFAIATSDCVLRWRYGTAATES